MMFHIVEFTKEKEVDVSPINWLTNFNGARGFCHWPPVKSTSRLSRLAKNKVLPGNNWQVYEIRSLGAFDTYEEAKHHLKKVEETSDLQSEAEQYSHGRKSPAPSYENGISDEESNEVFLLPHAPQLSKTFTQTRNPLNMHLPTTNSLRFDSNIHCSPSTSQHTQYLAASTSKTLPYNNTPPCSCSQLQLQILKSMQKTIEVLAEVQQTHTHYLMQLLNHPSSVASSSVPMNIPANFPVSLPLNRFEDLAPTEEYLKEETNFSEMVSYFASFGGQGIKKILQRVLPQLIGQELAVQLNWKGRGDKKSFQEYTHIHLVIYHAVKINATDINVTLIEVEKFLKDWLRFARDRFGGRKNRNRI